MASDTDVDSPGIFKSENDEAVEGNSNEVKICDDKTWAGGCCSSDGN